MLTEIILSVSQTIYKIRPNINKKKVKIIIHLTLLIDQNHFMNEAIERKIEKFSRNSTMVKKNKSNGMTDSNLLAAI
jgi:hypothetical protein